MTLINSTLIMYQCYLYQCKFVHIINKINVNLFHFFLQIQGSCGYKKLANLETSSLLQNLKKLTLLYFIMSSGKLCGTGAIYSILPSKWMYSFPMGVYTVGFEGFKRFRSMVIVWKCHSKCLNLNFKYYLT